MQFLTHALQLAGAQGYALANVDSTIILERPKLKDFRDAIRDSLAAATRLPRNCVSVKFKTAEKVGVWSALGSTETGFVGFCQ